MISSKPAEFFLDHDHVEDFSGRIYVVVGNTHPPGSVVAYLKYVPTRFRTPWCRGDACFERVIKRYGAASVLSTAREFQEELYDPSLGVTVPIVRVRGISAVYRPWERFEEILSKPRDQVEVDALIAYDRIRTCCGVPPSSLGVDGSIAVKIHNPAISDVDLVVYGCREAAEVADNVQYSFDRLSNQVEEERLTKMSETYGLPVEVLRSILAPYKRLYMARRGREVNIMFAPKEPGRYGESVLVPTAIVEADISVTPGDCRALFYPGTAPVDKVRDLRILGALKRVAIDISEVSRVVNYESLYSYPLYKGGDMKVRGVLSIEKPSGELVVTVGTREVLSYAIPKKT